MIQKGIDATSYQLLLVRKAVGEHRFTLASGFQHAKLKSRIEMMLKPGSSGWMRWSYVALVPVLGCFMFICNPVKAVNLQEATGTFAESAAEERIPAPNQEESAYHMGAQMVLFEQMPRFNGGDTRTFSRWLNSQSSNQIRNDGVQGRMLVQFTVGADGKVGDVKVLKGLREDLDNKVAQIIASSPDWEPGINANGVAVPVSFSMPIVFTVR